MWFCFRFQFNLLVLRKLSKDRKLIALDMIRNLELFFTNVKVVFFQFQTLLLYFSSIASFMLCGHKLSRIFTSSRLCCYIILFFWLFLIIMLLTNKIIIKIITIAIFRIITYFYIVNRFRNQFSDRLIIFLKLTCNIS